MSNRLPFLYIRTTDGKGRGVFTAQEIPQGSHIESCPVVIISPADTALIHQTILHDYYFLWGTTGQSAMVLGFGSLYNHASQPNADYQMDFANESMDLFTLHDIAPGEEITINYMEGGAQKSELWFEER